MLGNRTRRTPGKHHTGRIASFLVFGACPGFNTFPRIGLFRFSVSYPPGVVVFAVGAKIGGRRRHAPVSARDSESEESFPSWRSIRVFLLPIRCLPEDFYSEDYGYGQPHNQVKIEHPIPPASGFLVRRKAGSFFRIEANGNYNNHTTILIKLPRQ